MNFKDRHIGITKESQNIMLNNLGFNSLDELCTQSLASDINYSLPKKDGISEDSFEKHLHELGNQNTQTLSLIGQGFYPNYCPAVIRRNILENPCWYTQYTPYQAEISQGRLEALFNYQTLITELTGLQIANASLLDEGNACSEAIFMAYQIHNNKRNNIFLCDSITKNNRSVIKNRFKYLDVNIIEGNIHNIQLDDSYIAVICNQFLTSGDFNDVKSIFKAAKEMNITCILNCDLLASTLFMSAGEIGADIAIGSAQRLGVAMGYGGPSAAFLACNESFTRLIPGRIIGLSKDKFDKPAYRMALQTREQHIRRERATSNICTAQSLLAIISSFFAIYHGPEGLKDIALNIKAKTDVLIKTLQENGFNVITTNNFDTLTIKGDDLLAFNEEALKNNIEWNFNQNEIRLSLNQTITSNDIKLILHIFNINNYPITFDTKIVNTISARQSSFMVQDVFHKHHSETKMLRYMKSLEQKDLSLAHSMIPLGSCTMKLNATIELLGLSNPNFTNIHPFSNSQFTKGYQKLLTELENNLSVFTGFDGTSLQPNSGAQGEFAGLMCIRDYFQSINESHRDIALIPTSAHGTNPASASLCGLKIVQIKCLESGEICIDDLDKKIENHKDNIAAIMITYPSTFGVFDENIKTICNKIHDAGGQVYMDGANMNAQVGLTSPATIGADVCHLNLHKTFCIPHGGGGPGVGPICVKSHLVPFLPSIDRAISNTNYGSASICIISYAYIKLMGTTNLRNATQIAILNANYIAKRLHGHYEIMYTNKNNCVAHELIINCKKFKKESKITVEDIAKRLMDYGFHAPTMSWPVPDTLMIEPTESEGKDEIDRFCDALIEIKKEVDALTPESVEDSPLKNAPHTIDEINKEWGYSYSTAKAFFPLGETKNKFWPSVNRIDNVFGDRNLICSCQTFDISNDLEKNKVNA